jgi:DNA-binding CsgD family transcriptional regulator
VTTLSRSDLEATLGFLREAAAVTGPDPFPSELLDRLRELVRRGWVVYEEKDQAERLVFWDACAHGREVEPSRPEEELDRAYWRLRHQDPLCGYQQRTGDLAARKLSDFVSSRQWHGVELYAEYHRFWGSEERMQIGLATTPSNTKFLFFSGEWDFGERERLLLNLLRPHLTAMHAAARQRRLAAALQLEREGAGLVVLQSSDQVDFATPAAERLLARYFGGTPDDDLPEPVRGWLRHDSQRLSSNGLPPPATAPLSVEHGERRLTIRRAGRTLLLDEEIATLTRREQEIVDQLAEGHSNAEIAEHLNIAPTTVRKHLENIYAKLDVSTRTAAIAATRPEMNVPARVDPLSRSPVVTHDDKQAQQKINT